LVAAPPACRTRGVGGGTGMKKVRALDISTPPFMCARSWLLILFTLTCLLLARQSCCISLCIAELLPTKGATSALTCCWADQSSTLCERKSRVQAGGCNFLCGPPHQHLSQCCSSGIAVHRLTCRCCSTACQSGQIVSMTDCCQQYQQ
jgi:hypothetical protein